MAKITLATVKKFIRENRAALQIRCESEFSGMTDCVENVRAPAFRPAAAPEAGRNHENKLGIEGAWFVFGSRDMFRPFEADGFKGISVYNCCGSFVLAVRS